MSQIKLLHSGGNGVSIVAPDSNPASDRTLKLPSDGDGTILTTNSPVGKILQVVNQNLTTQMSTSSTSYVDTGLTASITPSATTSKVLVILCIATAISGDHNGYLRLLRDSTEINSGSGGDTNSMFGINGNSTAFRYSPVMYNSNFLDTPSTTSAITYKVQVRAHSGSYTMYINRRNIDTNFGVASNISLLEVAA